MESKSNRISKSDKAVIKWILKICKSQIPTLAFLIAVNIIHGVTSVFFANFSKNVIDGATVMKDTGYIIKFALALLGVVILQMSLSIIRSCVSERCKGRLDIVLKHHLLDVIMKKDYSTVTSYHTGELQNRMFNDVNIVTDGFTKILPQGIFFVTKLVSSLIYLIVLDKIFALVFLIGGCIVFAVTQLFRKQLKALHKKVQETEGKTRSFIQETVSNLLVVKAFSVEDKIQEQTDKLQEDNFIAKIKRRNFSIYANTGLNTVFSVGTVFAVAFGAWRILTGGMTYGDVTAMIQLVNQVQSPFASLSGIMPQYFSMIASAERLMEIDSIKEENHINECPIDVDKTYKELREISFKNISFKYDRDVIFDNTSLTVKKGDFVAITGISGIGKSTLLKLLLGVFNAQNGCITLKTTDGEIAVDKNTRRLFSYVPQGNMVVSGTIRENLTFINDDVTEDEIAQAVEVSCAKQFIDELPRGLETVIGEKGLGLSEGQIQRLAIARSLLSKAPILLLDEATSALDEKTEKQFLTNLRQLENMTCIIVSHKKAAIEICNKNIRIKNGKIIEG
ncbi:MAG TPA: ABC transporter ATP-binding protein/permease [Candidatus Eubacterium faecigallinarum]|nr:ABC transporter ATP-binding protein/permease [Candidatus Eubacterium faecigallinarum]